MTVILIVVVGVAIITGLTALILYTRHMHHAMQQQLSEAEERLRIDLAALSIVLRPPEPTIPKPRTTRPFTVIKGGAVAVLAALTGAWLWTRQHAALLAVAVGAGAALVIIPSATPFEPPTSGPPVAEPGQPSAPPTREPSEPPIAPPPTEPPPPVEPPTEPLVVDQAGSQPPPAFPPSTQPEPAPTEELEPPPPESTPPQEPPATEPPPAPPPGPAEACRRELELPNVHLCIDPVTSLADQLLE